MILLLYIILNLTTILIKSEQLIFEGDWTFQDQIKMDTN